MVNRYNRFPSPNYPPNSFDIHHIFPPSVFLRTEPFAVSSWENRIFKYPTDSIMYTRHDRMELLKTLPGTSLTQIFSATHRVMLYLPESECDYRFSQD
ncbi:hypothetical protein CDAR_547631 [Caerostris darwini]|uniref:Uncharacterized protein n=1 Tax=Caerostris darwini TaxID=1538125 RepID=A0AAV4R2B0_9ARAC|nr:hypothetical protein CDAR_547631 [Caerostris darwini]